MSFRYCIGLDLQKNLLSGKLYKVFSNITKGGLYSGKLTHVFCCIKNFYRKQAEKTNKQTDKNQTLEQGVK